MLGSGADPVDDVGMDAGQADHDLGYCERELGTGELPVGGIGNGLLIRHTADSEMKEVSQSEAQSGGQKTKKPAGRHGGVKETGEE